MGVREWFTSAERFLEGPPGDASALRDAAAGFDRLCLVVNSLIQRLEQSVQEITSPGGTAWTGPAAAAFCARWVDLRAALRAAANGFEDTAVALRTVAAAVDRAKDEHGNSLLLLAGNPLLMVTDLLGRGAQSGEALATACSRSSVELDRLAGAARQVAATAAAVASAPQIGGGTFSSAADALLFANQQDRRDADALATETADALGRDDPAPLLATLQELLGHRDDPVYTPEFFQRLGADRIRRMVERFQGLDGRDALLTFLDQALGAATRSPHWNHALTRQLFGAPPESGHDVEVTADLLRHGAYSADVLALAGTQVVMSQLQWGSDRRVPGGDQAAATLLRVIARDPAAAQRFLSLPDPFVDGGSRTNLAVLLDATYKDGWGDDGRALGAVLEAATLRGPDPDTSARLVCGMVETLATQVRRNGVELTDPLRRAVATILVSGPNVEALAHSAGAHDDAYATDRGPGVPRLPEDDVAAVLGELTSEREATRILLAGSIAYLRNQLTGATGVMPRNAGALLGLLYRSHREAVTAAGSANDVISQITNIIGLGGADGRLVKSEIQGVRSFLEMILTTPPGTRGDESFYDRVQKAMQATRAESLYASGALTGLEVPDPELTAGRHGGPLLSYEQIVHAAHDHQREDVKAYWDWVDRVTNRQYVDVSGHGDDSMTAWVGFEQQAHEDATP